MKADRIGGAESRGGIVILWRRSQGGYFGRTDSYKMQKRRGAAAGVMNAANLGAGPGIQKSDPCSWRDGSREGLRPLLPCLALGRLGSSVHSSFVET